MKKFLYVVFLFFFSSSLLANDINSPVGYWKTIDDISGKPEGILQIFESSDHTLEGKIIKNLSPERAKYKICTECKGTRLNQPIIGMVIMWGFTFDGKEWRQGHILDPTTGKTYRCKMKVVDNGGQLKVRGYLGIPLLGRTQMWVRLLPKTS